MDEINGKTVAVHEVKIDLLIDQQREVMKLLNEWLKAGGPCEIARHKTDRALEHVKWLWVVMGVSVPPTLGMLIKLAFFK